MARELCVRRAALMLVFERFSGFRAALLPRCERAGAFSLLNRDRGLGSPSYDTLRGMG